MSYDRQKEESNLARKENEAFQKYLESMDDELFIAVCDHLDNIEIHKIQDCLASNNLETVRAGIAKFKSAASEVVRRKIEQLKAYV